MRTFLKASFGFLTFVLVANVAMALDPESMRSDLVDRFAHYERSLSQPTGTSMAQRDLFAASLAASFTSGEDHLSFVTDLLQSSSVLTYLLASDTSFYWAGSAWASQIRNTYSYGSNHLQSQEIQEFYFGSAWTNQIRQSFTYDGSDRELTWLMEMWATDHWENSNNYTNTYDGGGVLTQVVSQTWSNGAWVNSTRATPTYAGNLLSMLTLEVWVNSAWVNSFRFVYTYDGFNRTTQTVQQNASGLTWVNYTRSTNTYDGNGDVSQVLMEKWVGSAWQNDARNNATFDGSHHQTLNVTYDWDTAGAAFVAIEADTSKYSSGRKIEVVNNIISPSPSLSRTDYAYDGNGNLTESIRQHWVGVTGASGHRRERGESDVTPSEIALTWNNTNRTVYVYTVAAVGQLGGDGEVPRGFSVSQNYPNPFNLSTVIDYSLARSGPVRIIVANILGQTVAELVDAYQDEGAHSAIWNGSDANGHVVASGIYFYRIQAGGAEQVRKMVLLK